MSETIIPEAALIEATSESNSPMRPATTKRRLTIWLGIGLIGAFLSSPASFAQETAATPSAVQTVQRRSSRPFKAMGAAVRSHLPEAAQGFMENFYDISL